MLSLLTSAYVLLAQADQITNTDLNPLAQWAQLSATAIIGILLVWVITKAFPALLARHDAAQKDARDHFEKILTNLDTSRSMSAREGHDAARHLSVAIDKNAEVVRENTKAVDSLSQKIVFQGR